MASGDATDMSHASDRPHLTPQFCFNQTVLRDFLRLSRHTVDDTIKQNLNALATPSKTNPFVSTTASTRRAGSQQQRQLPASACLGFQENILFPSWQARSDVLNYCAGVATSPDPNDPEHLLREAESAAARERLVDERLDPYSARYRPREARTEALANLVRNERMVESIVRKSTWDLVKERCAATGGVIEEDFEAALGSWRSRRNGKPSL